MSSDEEDYMSDAVLAGTETVKPGKILKDLYFNSF